MSLEERMMRLKAHLILHYGNVVGDPILDVNQFVEWFFQNLHQSIDDIEKRSASLEELGTEELLRLSYIKLRLSIIQLLSDRNLLSPDEELSSWLAIQKKLP